MKSTFSMRKFILALVLLLGILFILLRMAEVETIVETLQHGDWRFLLLAIGVVFLWLVSMAFAYQTIYRAIGLEEGLEQLLLVSTAAFFVNVVAPTAGMSGVALFAAEARRRNYSPGRAVMAGVLYVLYDYASFFCVLVLGLGVLFRRNHLSVVELTTSAIFLAIAIMMAALLFLGMRSAEGLGNVLAWIARLVDRILKPLIHRDYFSEKRAHQFARDAAEGLREVRQEPKKLLAPFLLFLTKQAILITILFLSFMAYQVPVSLGTLIASFAIGTLTLIVSPTPAGLGFVEGTLALVLVSMYVREGAALVITLTYRAFTFWIPLLFGMIAFRSVGKFEGVQEAENEV